MKQFIKVISSVLVLLFVSAIVMGFTTMEHNNLVTQVNLQASIIEEQSEQYNNLVLEQQELLHQIEELQQTYSALESENEELKKELH